MHRSYFSPLPFKLNIDSICNRSVCFISLLAYDQIQILQTSSTIDPARQAVDALNNREVRIMPVVRFPVVFLAPTPPTFTGSLKATPPLPAKYQFSELKDLFLPFKELWFSVVDLPLPSEKSLNI